MGSRPAGNRPMLRERVLAALEHFWSPLRVDDELCPYLEGIWGQPVAADALARLLADERAASDRDGPQGSGDLPGWAGRSRALGAVGLAALGSGGRRRWPGCAAKHLKISAGVWIGSRTGSRSGGGRRLAVRSAGRGGPPSPGADRRAACPSQPDRPAVRPRPEQSRLRRSLVMSGFVGV